MVDCEKCRNFDTEKCDECKHYEHDLEDHYDPLTSEELRQREEESRKKKLEACVVETMEIEVPAELADTIAILTQYIDRKHFCFPAVCCGKDELIATDGMTLVRVRQHVPAQLVGKYVLEASPGTVKLAKPYPDGIIQKCHEILDESKSNAGFEVKYDEILDKALSGQGYIKTSLGWGHTEKIEKTELIFADLTITFDKDRLLKALSLFYGCQSVTVYWPAENFQAVLFEAGDTEVLIMPLANLGAYRKNRKN